MSFCRGQHFIRAIQVRARVLCESISYVVSHVVFLLLKVAFRRLEKEKMFSGAV
jgi:hypothetical protein